MSWLPGYGYVVKDLVSLMSFHQQYADVCGN
jgi:hypothetical protein